MRLKVAAGSALFQHLFAGLSYLSIDFYACLKLLFFKVIAAFVDEG